MENVMFCIQFWQVYSCKMLLTIFSSKAQHVLKVQWYNLLARKNILIVRVSKSTSCRLLKKTQNVMFIFMSNLMVQYFGSFNLINTRVSDNYSMTLTFEKCLEFCDIPERHFEAFNNLKIHALIEWVNISIFNTLSGIRWTVAKGLHIYRLP